ncbi:MAG: hypothetical protein WCG27_01935 [Pseudomonadota bacterium]
MKNKIIPCQFLLFLMIFTIHAYFYGIVAWNQMSRYNSIYSFVETGYPQTHTFQIDRFITDPQNGMNTGDWSHNGEHFFSNKPPGTALLGIPIYWCLYQIEKILGKDSQLEPFAMINAYVINCFVSVFWTALSCVFLLSYLIKFSGLSLSSALTLSLLYGLGTLVFPFDTSLWGHPTAAAFIMIQLYFFTLGGPRNLFKAGFIFALAGLMDYLAFFSLALSFIYLLVKKTPLKNIFYFLAGTSVPIAVLLGIHHFSFGNPFNTFCSFSGAMNELGRNHDPCKFGQFSWSHFCDLLITPYRGLLLYCPIFILSLWQIGHLFIKRKFTLFHGLFLGNIIFYLVAVSTFIGWHGGSSTGPRYLIITLPFWFLLLPPLSTLPGMSKFIWQGLAGISVLQMLMITSVNTTVDVAIRSPMSVIYRQFWSGEFNLKMTGSIYNHWNWGQLFGLNGLWSLTPIFIVSGLFIMALCQLGKSNS